MATFSVLAALTSCKQSQTTSSNSEAGKSPKLFIDVHHLGAGKVTAEAVAGAHQKDLAAQQKYNVKFIKYWIDTVKGDVYCLSSATTADAVRRTHKEAHGLMPDEIYMVTEGEAASVEKNENYFLDIHDLGAGNVTAAAVEEAHKKDLQTEKKYGVHFINYWVNEKEGKVFCLSQAADASKVIKTHSEAHGLIPGNIFAVVQGQ